MSQRLRTIFKQEGVRETQGEIGHILRMVNPLLSEVGQALLLKAQRGVGY